MFVTYTVYMTSLDNHQPSEKFIEDNTNGKKTDWNITTRVLELRSTFTRQRIHSSIKMQHGAFRYPTYLQYCVNRHNLLHARVFC